MKTLLFKPFEKFQETQLLLFGIAATVIGSALAWQFNGRFDGALDLHFTGPVIWYHPLLDNIFNILTISLFMYGAGLIINKKTRVVDILAAAIVARAPLYALTVFNANDLLFNMGMKVLNNIGDNPFKNVSTGETVALAFFGLLSILFIVWYIALMWNGFKVATNAKGAGHIILFAVAILFSEVFSKLLISIFT